MGHPRRSNDSYGLGEVKAPLLEDLLGIGVGDAPLHEVVGSLRVLGVLAHGTGIDDGLVGVIGDDADNLHAAKAVYVGAVDDGDVNIAVFRLLAHVADRRLQDGGDAHVLTVLAGDVLATFAGVSCGRLVGANGGEGLGGIVAGRERSHRLRRR